MLVVVHGSQFESDVAALLHGVADRFHMDAEAAVGGQKAIAAGDFTTCFVGDAGLHNVIQIVARGVGVAGRNGNGEFAFLVQATGLFAVLVAVVGIFGSGVVRAFRHRGFTRIVRIRRVVPPVVAALVDAVFDFGIRDGFAEEILRFHSRGIAAALQHPRLRHGDAHLVFGLAVLLDAKRSRTDGIVRPGKCERNARKAERRVLR